ncbi:MAG: hypothetical protein GC166_06995 [Alphaproteobacteria bacterium]|nr:hypothetical protein [Alphaproteobacteria bacterium]
MPNRPLAVAALLGVLAGPALADDCSLQQMAALDMRELQDGRITVPVKVNGAEYQFLVDTGGVYSSLSSDIVKQLDLKKHEIAGQLYGIRGNRKKYGVSLDSFMIGPNEAKRFKVVVEDADGLPPGVSGILAPDMLSVFDADFDFGKKKLNLFSQRHCPGKVVYWTNAYVEVPFDYIGRGGHINFSMALDGKVLPITFDTGSAITLISESRARSQFGVATDSPGVERMPDAKDDWVVKFSKRFDTLTLDGVTVKNPMIYLFDDAAIARGFKRENSYKSDTDPIYGDSISASPLILGMNVIQKLHLYVAFGEKKIYATAAGDTK